MEDKMSRLSHSLMLKNIAANLEHLRVTNSEPDDTASLQTQEPRRSSLLTEPHQQLIQQHELQIQLQQEEQPAPTDHPPQPSRSTDHPPQPSRSTDRPTIINSPKFPRALSRQNMGSPSPRLIRKSSPIGPPQPTQIPSQAPPHQTPILSGHPTHHISGQMSPNLPLQLSNLVVNPTAHKQAPLVVQHLQDSKRLAQGLYNLGFRTEVAAHAAQQHKTSNANPEEIARMLIQQKANYSTANLMSRYGSLDNVNGESEYESYNESGPVSSASDHSRSQSPAVRCNSPGFRVSSPYRPPSPKPCRRASAFRPSSPVSDNQNVPLYSPYSTTKNYVVCPGIVQSRPNQISYIKYPQPIQPMRRVYDPQHLPPRSGPMVGNHSNCLPQYQESDYDDSPQEYFKSSDSSPPPLYTSNPCLNGGSNTNLSNIRPQQQQQQTEDLPPYDFVPTAAQHGPSNSPHSDNSSTGLTASSESMSVQERVKKLNQNIASQNTSYQNAVLSPKLVRKSSSTNAKPPKLKKHSKKHNSGKGSEDRPRTPFKIFSPLPRRKNKPAPQRKEADKTTKTPVPSEAVKFYLEQRIENLMKETANKKKRRDEFEESIANYPESEKNNLRRIFAKKESDFLRLKRSKIDKDMFTKIQTIGIGSFGEVTLVQKHDTGQLYAMKTLRKAEVWKRNQTAHVKAERDILSEADNEWVVKLHFSFQDKDNLYFVMDYVPGGDMMSLLIKSGKFPEWVACFYIAELLCAVESVHKLGFIHRDIKPDNILIDEKGHLKLTDFGLCTGFRWTHDSSRYQNQPKDPHNRQASVDFDENLWKKMQQNCQCGDRYNHQKPLDRRRAHQRCLAHSLVGTPNYIAPEVLLREWYNFECDWWSVGVILYEMIIGRPPFHAPTPADTQMFIINWRYYLYIPVEANIDTSSCNLIFELLQDPEKRLGKGGAHELKQHAFFSEIDWNNLHNTPAPFLPDLKFATDTKYFDTFDEDRVRFSDTEDSQDNDTPAHPFYEFTFRRFSGAELTKDTQEKGPVLV